MLDPEKSAVALGVVGLWLVAAARDHNAAK
jgi:hypothetical protein